MMTRDELANWLRLVETPGLGNATARRLLAAFGGPQQVLDAAEVALRVVAGNALAKALRTPDARREALVEATWRWLDDAPADVARHVLVLASPHYPALLLQTADPPLLLYAVGRLELLSAPGVAVVGSRHATPQGLENAQRFARQLSERGLAIVSGLALGIDGAAHEGGLEGVGSTVAFVGTGLDQVYPRSHAGLGRRIAAQGLIASEYALGTPPLAANFPRRNRLIAGLTHGTLVVEAALQSGSLITARLALEAGREVFAVPGNIHSPQSRGCHQLIRQGAKLVETSEDILEELHQYGPAAAKVRAIPSGATAGPPASAAGSAVSAALEDDGEPTYDGQAPDAALLRALGYDPVSFDALSARTGVPSDLLAARLLELELLGALRRLPGGLFQRCAEA